VFHARRPVPASLASVLILLAAGCQPRIAEDTGDTPDTDTGLVETDTDGEPSLYVDLEALAGRLLFEHEPFAVDECFFQVDVFRFGTFDPERPDTLPWERVQAVWQGCGGGDPYTAFFRCEGTARAVGGLLELQCAVEDIETVPLRSAIAYEARLPVRQEGDGSFTLDAVRPDGPTAWARTALRGSTLRWENGEPRTSRRSTTTTLDFGVPLADVPEGAGVLTWRHAAVSERPVDGQETTLDVSADLPFERSAERLVVVQDVDTWEAWRDGVLAASQGQAEGRDVVSGLRDLRPVYRIAQGELVPADNVFERSRWTPADAVCEEGAPLMQRLPAFAAWCDGG